MQFSSRNAMILFHNLLGDIPTIMMDTTNPHFKNQYASLGGILETLKPILKKHNAYIVTPVQADAVNEQNVLEITIMFRVEDTIETVSSYFIFPVLDNPQHVGSYLTYIKRYGILALLGQSPDKDDDGEFASTAKTAPKSTTRRSLR